MTSLIDKPVGYNPRLLGGGSVVPYVGQWSGERTLGTQVRRAMGGICYADETLMDRDVQGVLWARTSTAIGVGRPLFTKLHPLRQRRAMRRLLCQVCARSFDHDMPLWLIPAHDVDTVGDPEGMSTIYPPVCPACARISVRMCPGLRPGFVTLRARCRVSGVIGVVFTPAGRFGLAADDDYDGVVTFEDPALRWTLATLLAVTLTEVSLVELEDLS